MCEPNAYYVASLVGGGFLCESNCVTHSIGAILLQKGEQGCMKPVYYASQQPTDVEERYGEMEKGGLSLVFAVKSFRSYLLPRPFFFLTSQPALQFLVRKPNLAGKFAKWICELQEFSFTLITKSTTRASLADLLTFKVEEEETKVRRIM